jgi:VIT1/CCC1 family predicted Fe2+/Mn2+ transporter
VPLLAVTLSGVSLRIPLTAAAALLALVGLGALSAKLGGAPWKRAAGRVVLWSSLAMTVTYVIGTIVGANIA